MNILLTNDDGIHAKGLWALYRQFSVRHSVTVVAPDRERSAVGHGITLHQPLRAVLMNVNGEGTGYAVNGTPADCIKLGALELLRTKPDIVISGINPGANVGANAHYSGTVAGAREAALLNLVSLAVSINSPMPIFYDEAASFVEKLADLVVEKGLPVGVFLNVNIPDIEMKSLRGVSISRHGISVCREGFEKRTDPRKGVYYWQGIDSANDFRGNDTDGALLSSQFISITPMKCDMTDNETLTELKSWNIPM